RGVDGTDGEGRGTGEESVVVAGPVADAVAVTPRAEGGDDHGVQRTEVGVGADGLVEAPGRLPELRLALEVGVPEAWGFALRARDDDGEDDAHAPRVELGDEGADVHLAPLRHRPVDVDGARRGHLGESEEAVADQRA